MCVNDVAVCGAHPLFFLDYFATGGLDLDVATDVVKGIAAGCEIAKCALIGGETAEMPGMYKKGDYDLAGFVVGICERDKLIDGSEVKVGDKLIGLASSGLHSNGYSLARRVLLDELKLKLNAKVAGLSSPLGEELLRPTRIYVKTILSLLPSFHIKGMAHITGGGLPGNIIRILPPGNKAVIKKAKWEIPPIFKLIERGSVPEEEMWKTFNNGIGMALVVASAEAEGIVKEARQLGEKAFVIGEVVAGQGVEIT
jgi:phosphoribosylformylglycinamidine cyclo-ligase